MASSTLFPDYIRFHKLALETRDVDPVYPVLKRYLELNGVDPASSEGIRLSVAHLTWYDIGSAIRSWNGFDGRLPCATERRGNRDDKQLAANVKGWQDAAAFAGSLKAFLLEGLPDEPKLAWQEVMDRTQTVHGNGRWAAYKLAEILMKVNGAKLEPFHMGHANSSGPRHGMELLFDDLPTGNTAAEIDYLDDLSAALCRELRRRALPAPVEEVETSLCDFHALHAGRYYVGNDIDQMQGQLLASGMSAKALDDVFQARYDSLPHAYLGELNGWTGVDRDRQKAYKATGEILER